MSSDEREKQLLGRIDSLEKELDAAKNYDGLTGLYNKSMFIESVRNRFDKFPDKKYVIVCLDIEKFKFINDRFGFVEGDNLLSYIGSKLKERSVQYGSVAARIASDVFALLEEEKDVDAEVFGAQVQGWVSSYPLGIDIKIAIGVYHVEAKNIPVRLMCDRARLALETVKNNYMVSVAEYNKSVRDYMLSQNELLNDAEKAFMNHEFKIFLQPKFDIRNNKVIGAESLVRWQHEKRGLIYPKDFIPLFEQNMIVTRLDEYVWEGSCRLIREWIDKGYGEIPISVNVSRVDIFMSNVVERFVEYSDRYNIDRKLIEIEITESAFTDDENKIIDVVDKLRNLGFRVLMDDFGSGYSSLNILKDINVDVLKIDTRFLEAGKSEKNKGREILESVIRMAKWIGLQTIAEGVETDEQKHFLMDQGCYYAQGFYFSKPISEEEFEDIIKNPSNVSSVADLEREDKTIAIEELFNSDFMTQNLLNNILGGVVIYSFDGKNTIKLLKANELYYQMTKDYFFAEKNELDNVYPDDKAKVLAVFDEARKSNGRGSTVQLRVANNADKWFTARVFYLADKEDYAMYYASFSDSTEQMSILNNLNLSRASFETALDLIEATVLEYSFRTKEIHVLTNLKSGNTYLYGTTIKNAPQTVIQENIIHPASLPKYEAMLDKLTKSGEAVSEMLDLKYTNNTYKRCSVRAKTVYEEDVPVKIITIINSTGKTVS